MGIRVIKAGILDTIQDEGRKGKAIIGINAGGVMDPVAFYLANALVGNPLNEAVLEMHFPAPELYFECDHIIALAGADFSCCIDGISLQPGKGSHN
jgi:antagonist of KipI